jgi:hypothetical protein
VSDWRRQPGFACEFCGKPGHYIMVPPPISVVHADTEPSLTIDLPRRITCPEHRPLVRGRAEREQDPARFADRHGRPHEWGETEPELLRNALRKLIDRLGESLPDQAADLEAQARAKGLL